MLIWSDDYPNHRSLSVKRTMAMMPSGIPLAGELCGVPLLDESRVSSRVIATLKTMVYMDILESAFFADEADEEIALKLNMPLGIDVERLVKRGVAKMGGSRFDRAGRGFESLLRYE